MMSSLLPAFKNILSDFALFRAEDEILVAVSGGLDSVVLCHLLHQCGQKMALAHVNYGLRGSESDGDELLVRALAQQLECKAFFLDAKKEMSSSEKGVQQVAREIRYQWFNELQREHHIQFLLTAHHLNDQIETILFQYLRGGMWSSLRGMLPLNDRIFRPLLTFQRKELIAFAEEHKLEWREDSSNQTDDYQRNYLRHQVLPLLLHINPNLEQSIASRASLFREGELLQEKTIQNELRGYFEKSGSENAILKTDLLNCPWPRLVLYHWLKPHGFSSGEIDAVMDLIPAQKGKYISSGEHRIWSNAEHLTLVGALDADAAYIVIEQLPWNSPDGAIILDLCSPSDVRFDVGSALLYADFDLIRMPLICRDWQAGDVFQPFGMTGKKKVSDYLMQEKVSAEKKASIKILTSQEKVVAIPGYRIAESFRLKNETKMVLRISFMSLA
jgi:tRNA(Ile)-lysidine synthase